MTDEQQERLALALIQLREAKGKIRQLKAVERNPFYELRPEEREAVLALDHIPRRLGEIEATIREALPGTVVLIEDFYIGGHGYGNYSLRIGDHWLALDQALDAPRMGMYRIRLPEGV